MNNNKLAMSKDHNPIFLQQHNFQIIRKSLSHLRKSSFDQIVTLRRNNSSTIMNFNANKQILPPENLMLGSVRMASKPPQTSPNNINNLMFLSSANSMKSSLNHLPNKQAIKSKLVNIDCNQKSQETLNRINQIKGKLTTKAPQKLIKIFSSEKLKTPNKEDRPSWKSKESKESDGINEKKEIDMKRTVSFFYIKNKTIIPKKDNFEGVGVSVEDSLIIEENKEEKIESKITKETKDKTHINDIINSLIEKNSKKDGKFNKRIIIKSKDHSEVSTNYRKKSLASFSDTTILSCKFNKESNFLAVGVEDGITRIMTTKKSF